MSLVNHSKREINVKVVYAGLPRTGKSTNLTSIYERLKPEFRGQSRTIPMAGCVMRMCEFQPPGSGALQGFSIRYHLYTLAGEAIDDAQWRMVLKGADGIVFVADANPAHREANRDAFALLLSRLNGIGLDLSQVPIVVQANFQDLPEALSPAAMQQLLTVPGLTVVPAIAARGEGVLETLTTVVRKVTTVIQKQGIPAVEADEEIEPVESYDTPDLDQVAGDAEAVEATPPAEVAFLGTENAPAQAVDGTLALLPGGEPLDIAITLEVAGVKKAFVMTVSLREAGAMPCAPLRGAAYVR